MTDPIPEGFSALTPHLVVDDAAKAIDFYQRAFGAEEICRMPSPDGRVMHAELGIGGARMMLADDFPEFCGGVQRAAKAIGGSPVTVHLYVPDVDATMKRAAEAGATVTMPAVDMFWGDRYGKLQDPFGHDWSVATHVKDVTPEEMEKAAAEAFAGPPQG